MAFRLKRHFVLMLFLSLIVLLIGFGMIVNTNKNSWIVPKSKIIQNHKTTLMNMKTTHKPHPADIKDTINQSVFIAKQIMEKKKLVLFTLINNAYIPFAYSWLCNTVNMGIHQQILFIATDVPSKEKLEHDWPSVKVVLLPVDTSLNGNQAYSKVGYVKLMVKRTEILHSLLQHNIEILLFEVDCLWISNPIDECKKNALTNDVIVTCIAGKPSSIAGGFIYMKPTKAMKNLWGALTNKMRALGKEIDKKDSRKPVSESKNDQMFFMQLIQNRFSGIKYTVLPWNNYIDGKWYAMKLEERKKKKVVIINNNWVIGNKEKLKRAKAWGHWFIDDKMKCNMSQVEKVVNKGLYL